MKTLRLPQGLFCTLSVHLMQGQKVAACHPYTQSAHATVGLQDTYTGESPGNIFLRQVPMCASTSFTSSEDAIFMEMLHFSVSIISCKQEGMRAGIECHLIHIHGRRTAFWMLAECFACQQGSVTLRYMPWQCSRQRLWASWMYKNCVLKLRFS